MHNSRFLNEFRVRVFTVQSDFVIAYADWAFRMLDREGFVCSPDGTRTRAAGDVGSSILQPRLQLHIWQICNN